MATVPYNGGIPTVAPQATPPEDYQHIQATPEAFGGGVAEGAQKLGAGATKAGQFFGEVAASNTSYDYMKQANDVVTNFEGLSDEAAMKAAPQVRTQLDQLFKTTSSNLQTPEQQFYFNEYSRRFNTILDERIGSHLARQTDSWYTQVENKGLDAGMQQVAAADPNSSTYQTQIDHGTAMAMQATLRQFRRQVGPGPLDDDATAVMNDRLTKVRQAAVKTQVEALAPTDPVRALAVLNDPSNRRVIGQYYEPLSAQLRSVVTTRTGQSFANQAFSDVGQTMANPATTAPMPISDAIHTQEWAGKGPAPVSTAGAVGPGQILPSTWVQWQKEGLVQPGENINNPADNLAVSNRAIAKFQAQWPNDPARVAVAYYSGPGNVRPLGEAGPAWVTDVSKDSSGKPIPPVSSYVSSVVSRTNPVATFKANAVDRLLDLTKDQPPEVRQAAMKELTEQLNNAAIASQQTQLAQKQRSDAAADQYVQMAAKAKSSDDVQMLLQHAAADPNLDFETKKSIPGVIKQYISDELKNNINFGPGYVNALHRLTLPDNDPNKITSYSQLLSMADPEQNGGQAQLYSSGLKELTGMLKTPDGNIVARIQTGQLAKAKSLLSFEEDFGNFKIPDPDGQRIFEGGFIPAFYQAYNKGLESGKSPYQLLSPGSPDYITDKLIASFQTQRTDAQKAKALMDAQVQENELKNNINFGPGYVNALHRLTLPDNDPNKITSYSQLLSMADPEQNGGQAQLYSSGLKELTGMLKTPDGNIVARIQTGQLAKAKSVLSRSEDLGMYKSVDVEGDRLFEGGFIPAFYKAYNDGLTAGKSPYQLLSPGSPDYITDKLLASFVAQKTDAERVKDALNVKVVPKPNPADEELRIYNALGAGKMTDEEAIKELTALGLNVVKSNAPPTPAPAPTPPVQP